MQCAGDLGRHRGRADSQRLPETKHRAVCGSDYRRQAIVVSQTFGVSTIVRKYVLTSIKSSASIINYKKNINLLEPIRAALRSRKRLVTIVTTLTTISVSQGNSALSRIVCTVKQMAGTRCYRIRMTSPASCKSPNESIQTIHHLIRFGDMTGLRRIV